MQDMKLDNQMNNAMLPAALPPSYYMSNMAGGGGMRGGMGVGGGGMGGCVMGGLGVFSQGDELGHTLNADSFGEAFGGGGSGGVAANFSPSIFGVKGLPGTGPCASVSASISSPSHRRS